MSSRPQAVRLMPGSSNSTCYAAESTLINTLTLNSECLKPMAYAYQIYCLWLTPHQPVSPLLYAGDYRWTRMYVFCATPIRMRAASSGLLCTKSKPGGETHPAGEPRLSAPAKRDCGGRLIRITNMHSAALRIKPPKPASSKPYAPDADKSYTPQSSTSTLIMSCKRPAVVVNLQDVMPSETLKDALHGACYKSCRFFPSAAAFPEEPLSGADAGDTFEAVWLSVPLARMPARAAAGFLGHSGVRASGSP